MNLAAEPKGVMYSGKNVIVDKLIVLKVKVHVP